MRLIVTGISKEVMRAIRHLLTVAAICMLGYCGFVLADSWIYQRAQQRQLEQLQMESRDLAPASPELAPPPKAGELIGRLEILHLGISAVVFEGTDESTLRRSIGHVSGTSFPGKPGNVAIAGHRDTFFRPLRDIRRDDVITLATPGGDYRYRVVSTRIVRPTDMEVLDSSETEILTLITCYPFRFVGFAPERFVVRAERMTPLAN